jgi:hypothetical protein
MRLCAAPASQQDRQAGKESAQLVCLKLLNDERLVTGYFNA